MSGNHRLVSEDVVVSAPASFSGSAQRIWHITRDHAGWTAAGFVTLAIVLIVLAWCLVLCWYLIFGLLLVPYRLIRRGQRKQRLAQIRHQEMMNRTWAAGDPGRDPR
jgi:hypothetical protein